MSQGGEVTTQQLVYGPDGKVYGNPALARAAGVNQTYRQDGTPYPETLLGSLPLSPSVPITETFDPSAGIGEFERRQFLPYNQPMPNPPSGGKGGADPYSQITGQMGYGSDPYSQIMAQMTPTMNPYTGAGVAIGGYDPRLYNNAFVGSNSRLNLSGLLGGGGGGGGGDSAGGFTNPFSDLTPAQQAAYYAENPTMAAITRAGQGLFGATYLGQLQNYFNPGFQAQQNVLTYGYAPELYADPGLAVAADAEAAARGSYSSPYTGVGNPGESYTGGFGPSIGSVGADYGGPADGGYGGSPADADPGAGGYGGSVGADYGGPADGGYGGSPADADSGAGGYGGDSGGYGGGDGGGYGGGDGAGYAKGGKVTKDRLKGPDPKGPDEGYGALLSGEYVIKKSAVKKYGQGLLDMINDGKIPSKKMKSLLG
jgi:hypothetical protein